jgi:hypothetical protein
MAELTIKRKTYFEIPEELQESIKQTISILDYIHNSDNETLAIFDTECKKIADRHNYLELYDLRTALFTLFAIARFAEIDFSKDLEEDEKYWHDVTVE